MGDINRAFVLEAVKQVAFREVPLPKLKNEHDVIVHVHQTGICGSDVHYWQRGRLGDYILTNPIVLGHESAGVITQVGSKVCNVKVGDRVTIEPGVPCRRCKFCRSGNYNLCLDMVFAATPPYDGTLQKYYTVPSDYVYAIPDDVTLEDAALVEPLSVAVQMVKTSGLRSGQSVVVFGCGPIGVLCQAVARAAGAKKVIGIDISKARAKFAMDFSADGTYIPSKPVQGIDPMDASRETGEAIISEFQLDGGADVVLECTGVESCIQSGIFTATRGGTFVQAGLGKENVMFPITLACLRGLTIKGSLRYAAGCYPDAIELISSGKVQVSKLITHRFRFEEALEAFETAKAAEEGTFKCVIEGDTA